MYGAHYMYVAHYMHTFAMGGGVTALGRRQVAVKKTLERVYEHAYEHVYEHVI